MPSPAGAKGRHSGVFRGTDCSIFPPFPATAHEIIKDLLLLALVPVAINILSHRSFSKAINFTSVAETDSLLYPTWPSYIRKEEVRLESNNVGEKWNLSRRKGFSPANEFFAAVLRIRNGRGSTPGQGCWTRKSQQPNPTGTCRQKQNSVTMSNNYFPHIYTFF